MNALVSQDQFQVMSKMYDKVCEKNDDEQFKSNLKHFYLLLRHLV